MHPVRLASFGLFASAVVVGTGASGVWALHPSWGTFTFFLWRTVTCIGLLMGSLCLLRIVSQLRKQLGPAARWGRTITVGLVLYAIDTEALTVNPTDQWFDDLWLLHLAVLACLVFGSALTMLAFHRQQTRFSQAWGSLIGITMIAWFVLAFIGKSPTLSLIRLLIIACCLLIISVGVGDLTDNPTWESEPRRRTIAT